MTVQAQEPDKRLPGVHNDPKDHGASRKSGNFYTPQNDLFYANFTYDSPDPLAHQIRLLKILPRHSSGVIQCELLQGLPVAQTRDQYFALSYCAGDPSQTRQIIVNGLEFNVFANLGHALEEVIHYWHRITPGEEHLLWVDQICINQMNASERSHQVGFMRSIYSNAHEVLICLSTRPRSKTDGNGFRWLKKLTQAPMYRTEENISSNTKTSGATRSDDKPLSIAKELKFDGDMFEAFLEASLKGKGCLDLISLYDILNAPWWRRAWVFQELLVAQKARLLYARLSITWENFSMLALAGLHCLHRISGKMFAHEHGEGTPDSQNSVVSAISTESNGDMLYCDVCRLRDTHSHSESIVARGAVELFLETRAEWSGIGDLFRLLMLSCHCKSSDPRDRVYAFIGLTELSSYIDVDYNATIPAVLIETAQKMVLVEQRMEMIQSAVAMNSRLVTKLPSWIPDWTENDRITPPLKVASASWYVSACFGFKANFMTALGSPYCDELVLKANGYRLDVISSLDASSCRVNSYIRAEHRNLLLNDRRSMTDLTLNGMVRDFRTQILDFLGHTDPAKKRSLDFIRDFFATQPPTPPSDAHRVFANLALFQRKTLERLGPAAIEAQEVKSHLNTRKDDSYVDRRFLFEITHALKKDKDFFKNGDNVCHTIAHYFWNMKHAMKQPPVVGNFFASEAEIVAVQEVHKRYELQLPICEREQAAFDQETAAYESAMKAVDKNRGELVCRRIMALIKRQSKANPDDISDLQTFRTDADMAVITRPDVLGGDEIWALAGLSTLIILRPGATGYRCISNIYGRPMDFQDPKYVLPDGTTDKLGWGNGEDFGSSADGLMHFPSGEKPAFERTVLLPVPPAKEEITII